MVIVLDGRFRFTIITAFYNTGDYLKESIESIINQAVTFSSRPYLGDKARSIAYSKQFK